MTKTKKDQMLSNYQFAYSTDKNPYDFLPDPETGLRPDQTSPPKGIMVSHLTASFGNNQTFPPMAIWSQGEWLSDMPDETFADMHPPKGDQQFDTWVVPGEGTPGNFTHRLYVLPSEFSRHNLSGDLKPKHPLLWPKKWQSTTPVYSGWKSGSTSQWSSPKLPYGVRIRCTKCGHWFRADDLSGHVECCPQVQQFSDWAISCECCTSMDDTVKVKDGFPRDMYGAKEVTDNGAGAATTERPPGDPADAEGGVAAV